MKYDELCAVEDAAWKAFYNVLELAGLNKSRVIVELDRKDCFNSVSDAIFASVELECEEE